jgi:hypothetical protein
MSFGQFDLTGNPLHRKDTKTGKTAKGFAVFRGLRLCA